MILLDTSTLVDAFCGQRRLAPALRETLAEGHRIRLPALVLYEWLRGPRLEVELEAQGTLFPPAEVVPFGPTEAKRAAFLYSGLKRARGREIDIAVAATALAREATIWTLNKRDFDDIPGLTLYRP